MSELGIIKIIFGIFLTIGFLVLLFIAFKLYYKYLIQETKCKIKTKGIVKKYTLASRGGEGSGVHLPVVYYNVNDKEYKVIGPEYKGYKVINASGITSENTIKFQEKDQVLYINRTSNSIVGVYKNPLAEMYPLNSEVDVFYDENNPKLSYVLRYCNKKYAFWLTFLCGVLVMIIDLCILFVL